MRPPGASVLTHASVFPTENAGILSEGDEFRLKLAGEDGNFSVFKFIKFTTTSRGASWVTAYGGDTIKKDHNHRRQWHAFDPERVAREAQPPGRMASKRVEE